MSAFGGTPDFLYSVGADTKALDKAMADTSKKAESAFGKVGTSIEKKTEGLRKFQGALSSTIGVATGLVGVFGAAAGAAFGLYKAYESIAGAADRVAEANRKSNQLTQQAIDLAYKKIAAEENFLAVLKKQNKETIEARLAELRQERDKIDSDIGFGRQFMYGAMTLLKFGAGVYEDVLNFHTFGLTGNRFGEEEWIVDSGLVRYQSILEDIGQLEEELGEIDRGTESKADAEVTAELQEQEKLLRSQLDLQAMRASGDEAGAAKQERFAKHQEEILKLENRYLELTSAGLHEQAAEIENLIRLKNRLYTEGERITKQDREKAAAEKQARDAMEADNMQWMLQERILRAQGMDAIADQLKLEAERADLLERINGLETSDSRRSALREQVEQLMALQGGEGSGSRGGQRFGASTQGNIGTVAATQVLGGGVNVDAALAKQRTSSTKAIEGAVKEILITMREGRFGGPAVFV